jgi:hypothetical protein
MIIPESAIKPFEPHGIPLLEMREELSMYIENAIHRELLDAIKARIGNHKQRSYRMCTAARIAGADHASFYLQKYGSNNQFMRYFIIYQTPDGGRHVMQQSVTIV